MPIVDSLITVTAVEEQLPYNLPGHLDVFVSLFPPGVGIALSLPPFTIVLDASQATELAAVLLELAAEL